MDRGTWCGVDPKLETLKIGTNCSDGMSLMKAAICIILILGGTVFCVVAAGALFLVMREGQPQDRMVAKSVSPDGRRTLELHQVIAPVHGGADHLQITIGDAAASFGDVVFSQKFECSDFKTFVSGGQTPHMPTSAMGRATLGMQKTDR
jgi:hypothetical protein